MADKKRVAWAITGSGDRINKILSVMAEVQKQNENIEIRIFISKAGEQVLKWYQLFDKLKTIFKRVKVEINSNAPFLAGEVQIGYYELLLIAPVTSNSVAKMSLGIGDTMISNAASMAMKVSLPIYILPSDYEVGNVTTRLPNGRDLELKIRDKDVRHVRNLEKMDNVYILRKPEEIFQIFKA